jgi:hypothetical protein
LIFAIHWYGENIEKENIIYLGRLEININNLLKDSSINKLDEIVEISGPVK